MAQSAPGDLYVSGSPHGPEAQRPWGRGVGTRTPLRAAEAASVPYSRSQQWFTRYRADMEAHLLRHTESMAMSLREVDLTLAPMSGPRPLDRIAVALERIATALESARTVPDRG